MVDRKNNSIPLKTIFAVDGIVVSTLVLLFVAWQLRHLLELLLVSGFLAMILAPGVDIFMKTGIKRLTASLLVSLMVFLLFIGLFFLFASPLYDAGIKLTTQLPHLINQLKSPKGPLSKIAFHGALSGSLQTTITKAVPSIASAVEGASSTIFSVIGVVLSGLVGIITIAIVTFLMLLQGPALLEAVASLVPQSSLERIRAIAKDASISVFGFVVGNLATSIVAASVIYTTLRLLGVPFALLLSIWVALVDLIPLVGGLLAGIPIVGVALAHSITAAVVVFVVFIVYQEIENHLLSPIIMRKTVNLSPLLVIVSVIGGSELDGVVGALLAIPVAGVLQVVVMDIIKTKKQQETLVNSKDVEPNKSFIDDNSGSVQIKNLGE